MKHRIYPATTLLPSLALALASYTSFTSLSQAAPLAPPIVQNTGTGLRVDWAPNSQLFVSDDLKTWTLAPVPTTSQRANFAIDKPNKFFRVVQNGQVSDAAGFNLPVHPLITEVSLPSLVVDGTSPIEVTFATPPGSAAIPMSLGGLVKIFRDDGTAGDKVAGDGKFTATMFLSGAEVTELDTWINGLPPGTVQPMFKGREWIGNVPVAPLSLNGLPPGTPYVFKAGYLGANTAAPSKSLGSPPSVGSAGGVAGAPGGAVAGGAAGGAAGGGPAAVSPLAVGSWDKSLMITDLSVVNDPTRTFDPCAVQGLPGTGTPMGAWTFGKLMTDMTPTGVDPRDFVRRWLESWVVNQTINNDVVADRLASIQTSIITPWEVASGVGPGGLLDLAKAPFRLCAIVNRVDLRQTNGSPYGGGTVKDDPCNPICEAGEARFVFCALGPVFHGGPAGGGGTGGSGGYNQTSCELPFTVILEYCVPRHGCEQIKAWAQQWLALESIPFGPAYNGALQAITDQFTLPGQGTSGPQHSAISQIRSNEILQGPWEMREWRIFNNDSDAGWLREVTVKQTPAWVHNGMNEVQTFLQAAANVGQFTLPGVTVPLRWQGRSFLGGASPMPNFRGFPTYWDGPLPVGSSAMAMDDRHSFSLNTCSGCHHGETGNYKSNPAGNLSEFTHVSERPMFAPSTLSGFLTGITTGAPDPALTGAPNENWNKTFADLVRRHVDLIMVAKQPCFFRIFDTAIANVH